MTDRSYSGGIRLSGIASSVPPHVADQQTIRSIVRGLFDGSQPDVERILAVFDHDHIHSRHFIRHPSWYAEPHTFAEANAVGIQAARELAAQAARTALDGCIPHGVVVVNSTVVSTPSLDSYLIQDLGLPPTTRRTPIVGIGCAGGVAGLARAAELSAANGGAPYLLVCVEVCSATFQRNDMSKSNLVGTSLFADGAAAVLVSGDGQGPEILNSYSTWYPNTEDVMGWDVRDTGLHVRFSRDIPAFVVANFPLLLSQAYHSWGIDAADVQAVISHPGGAKVLEALSMAGGWPLVWFDVARNVLRKFGNMSSPSVLFVLEEMIKRGLPSGHTVMSALGPGFSAELVLLRS